MNEHVRMKHLTAALTACILLTAGFCPAAEPPQLREIEIKSSLDGVVQKALFWAPESARGEPTPMLVFLHSWSGNYKQNNATWRDEAFRRGWIFLQSDFRGPNNRPMPANR